MARTDETTRRYRKAEREFAQFLDINDVVLVKLEDRGLQRDEEGWEHFAWTMHVARRGYRTDPDQPVYAFPYMMGTAHTRKPRLTDLIAALLIDATCVTNAASFEEFCADLGYDADSIKARKTYDQIQVNTGNLRRLFPRHHTLGDLIAALTPYAEKAGLL